MAIQRNAFRSKIGLPGRVVVDDGYGGEGPPVLDARAVDLSRTGVGLVCEGGGTLEVGGLVRVIVEDTQDGNPVGRHWSGRVVHAREASEGVRVGVAFDWPVGPGIRSESAMAELPKRPSGALGGLDSTGSAGAEWWVVPTAVSLAGLVADQAGKAWAASLGSVGEGWLDLIPGVLAVVAPVENAGALANLAAGSPWTAPACAAVAGLAMVGLSASRSRVARGPISGAALGLIGAGILGNSVDRLALGYVRDFLVSGLSPRLSFNLADVFLVAGALVLALRAAAPGGRAPAD